MKERRLQLIKDSVQNFKDQKDQQKLLVNEAFEKYLVEKREEVTKAREITKIIQTE